MPFATCALSRTGEPVAHPRYSAQENLSSSEDAALLDG